MSASGYETGSDEPVAVVGISCRLPGAADPDEFWRLLHAGVDAVAEVPADRWPDAEATEYPDGGFLPSVDRFDAAFFGISPNEAAGMDPQQRLALELAWEALERARIAPTSLRDSATAVIVGAINDDYAMLHDRLGTGPHTMTGVHRSMLANRVSYLLGLRGPSLTVDAGQCSSLLAVQLACEQLRRGDVGLALAGGVNLMLVPETTEAIGSFGALSPDGRCWTFDSRANGYVRGEGGAVVVLKRLSVALADGDPVHCVILGGAVNNDGGGDGLTVPSESAQLEVLGLACRRAGVAPGEIQYVELHGTGTPVGDPIEAAALGAALGAGRPADAPLLVGSVKTNIGHLEGAAGIAGFVKTALSIAHRTLPPSLNFEVPSPAIPLGELRLDVVREARDWPGDGGRLVAGVSSFGMGGTNCHLVLASPPPPPPPPRPAERAGLPPAGLPWVLSARDGSALRAQAAALSRHLGARTEVEPADVALSLLSTRTRFEHRAVVLGTDGPALLAGVSALAAGRLDEAVVTGRAVPGRVALVFPGQGSQWPGMARDLLVAEPAFATRAAECAAALARYLDFDMLDVLREAPGAPGLDRVDVVQPALWAVMVSLATLWRSRGVKPDMVIGHSQGEIAAATVVGALTLDDAARVVALRSRAIRGLSGGGMLSVGAPADVVTARMGPGVTLAAENGPGSVVVSGDTAALAELQAALEADGHQTKMLPVDYASHSAAVDGLRDRIRAELAPVRPLSADGVFVSTVTGEPMDAAGLDADYWFRSLRQTVRFTAATRQALALGCSLLIECSPHPVLGGSIEETAEDAGDDVVVVGTLRRGEGGPDRFRRSLAEAWVGGADVCLGPLHGAPLTDLPTYAFQRERHWLAGRPTARAADAATAAEQVPVSADQAPVPAADRRALRQLVTGATAAVLGHHDGEAIDPARPFKELGLTSAGAVELRNRLKQATGLRLLTTVTFDFPTPARLGDHLRELVSAGASPALRNSPVPTPVAGSDPVVIVAMGCRYPGGASSPAELWELLASGTDAISAFPANRGWDLDALLGGPGRPGTCAASHGGFLHDADEFDAAFFGLSPREALAMDPQQRLLLETTWEALERAGIDPASLAGSPTGVFVGAMTTDYGPRLHQPTGAVDGHLLTGTALSVASGRIAYTFGLQGPALTVDTACSSSLVALQLATEALRRGECSLAVAGGVTLMANPGILVEFTRQDGLSADGRAKAFSATADGTSFAEGAGMLVLERLSDARRNGHPVLAVIRGVAVNSDGASNGLTAPNGQSQQQVIRRALADAGLEPSEVDAVEAHGTGTALGDPIEAHALLATYGQGRAPDEPLWLGSVKSNIGHTQAAAGVAGVMKMVLAMRHGVLPRTLHTDERTPAVDWDSGRVELLTEAREWPEAGRPRRAAVSGFGISGTNAHLVLEAAPPDPEPVLEPADPGGPLVWVLSARSDRALRANAGRLRDYAGRASDADLVATGPALAQRPSFAHRAVVVAASRDELTAGLAAAAAGASHPAVSAGVAMANAQPVFVFPGQGAQWVGMAAELLDANPVFAAELRRCDEALRPHTGWSVLDVIRRAAGAPELTGTDVVQPALFAMMVALAATWQSAGVEPAAVVGHSQGEIAAACVAGALSLAEAAKVVALRSQVLSALDGTGAVLAVALPASEVQQRIVAWPGRLWLAVDNGPSGTVVAGDLDAADEFLAAHGEEVRIRRTQVDYAAHTPHVTAVRKEWLARIGELTPACTEVAICSSAVGDFIDGDVLDAEYWYRNLADPVRFDTAVRTFAAYARPLFVECSPHPILAGAVRDILGDAGIEGTAVGTLKRDAGGPRQFLTAAAEAYAQGAAVSWPALLGPVTRRPELPTYAFDRRRFWLDGTPGGQAHPLLDATVEVAESGGLLLTGRLSRTQTPWLADHAVAGTVLLPGTALVELALQAAAAVGADGVDDLTLQAPLLLPESGPVQLQLSVGGEDEHGRRPLGIHARAIGEAGTEWTRHATGLLGPVAPAPPVPPTWPPADGEVVDLSGAYERLARAGYEYGPAFRGLVAAWAAGSERYVEVRLPSSQPAAGYAVHPALLDAALHILVLDAADAGDELLLPFSWSGVRLAETASDTLRVRLSRSADGDVALAITGGDGCPLGQVAAVSLRPAQAMGETVPRSGLERLEWVRTPLEPVGDDARQWAVVGTDPRAAAVADAVRADGIGAPLYYELASVRELGTAPDAVLLPYLPDPQDAAEDPPYAVHEGLSELLDVVQQWVTDERGDSRLVVLADPHAIVSAPAWGLLRSAAAEHPGRFALADVGDGGPGTWRLLAAALDAGESQCAVRDGTVLVPRVAAGAGIEGTAPDLTGGTVLVTGGTSGLGALVAGHLVERHGVRDLLLASRRGLAAAGAAELVAELERRGATVRVAACDFADRRAVAGLLDSIPTDRPLVGVLHAAGVLDDGTIAGLSPQRLDTVLRPKVDAGWLLHELTADLPLSAFVLFSSVAGVLGTLGQAGYAAANAFLDALAQHRAGLGLPGVSIAWGLWSQSTGMTAGLSAGDRARLGGTGLAELSAEEGLAMFDAALAGTGPVLAAHWDLVGARARAEAGGEIPAVLRRLVRLPSPVTHQAGAAPVGTGTAAQAPSAAGLAARLSGLDRADAGAAVQNLVRAQVAAALGHGSAAEVEVETPFSDLGMDSLTAVELRNRLSAETGLRLPATLVFNQPTVTGLSGYLLRELVPPPPAPDQVLRQALDQVAAHLGGTDAQPDERERVMAVLQAAVARLAGTREDGDPLASLGLTSDEEMFQFIDSEL